MLRELIEVSRRLQAEGELPPSSTKWRRPVWIIQIDESCQGCLVGPYKRGDHRPILAPDRQRSGKIGPKNLKPYLLMDDARYALGVAEPGKQGEAEQAHSGFIRLLEAAERETVDMDVTRILKFLRQESAISAFQQVAPKDIITFRSPSGDFPCERDPIRRFWAGYLAAELAAVYPAGCSACGQYGAVLKTMPNEVVVMGQKCQVTSFNSTAFTSRGKHQSTNAPLCYDCAATAISALNYMSGDIRHKAPLGQDVSKGRGNPLRNQLAVYWLTSPVRNQAPDIEFDLEAALGEIMQGRLGESGGDGPPPDLSQLEALLAIPWTGHGYATNISTNEFHVAVLSANKARLVVRDWLVISLDDVRGWLKLYLQALRIVGPAGEDSRAFPIPVITSDLETSNPEHTRNLLHVAYLGEPPAASLQRAAVARFRDVLLSGQAHVTSNTRSEEARRKEQLATLHTLASVLKLTTTFWEEDALRMEQLDSNREVPAYHCGRLLAILEEAQKRASNGRLNTTIVDRFYASASTAPAATLGTLVSRSENSHLPKIRKEKRGHEQLQRLIEEVMARFDKSAGIPRVLTMPEQADFALGYYHQRAAFRHS